MRISTNPGSPHAIDKEMAARTAVYLNGQEVSSRCVEADDAEGYVYLIERADDGRPLIEVRGKKAHVRKTRMEGEVIIGVAPPQTTLGAKDGETDG